MRMDDRMRHLVLLVKSWAKSHQIKEASHGSFNSYTLTLLVVLYLQTKDLGLLPPLSILFPEFRHDLKACNGESKNVLRIYHEFCDNPAKWMQAQKSKHPQTKDTLAELFLNYLLFLEHYCSSAQEVLTESHQQSLLTLADTYTPWMEFLLLDLKLWLQ